MSLNHHPHQIDTVVTATGNQPPIIVTDVIGLLPNDSVAVVIDSILQQMNLMNTHRQKWMNHKWHTPHMRIV